MIKMRRPKLDMKRKLRLITDYNTEGMSINTILKRNHISVHTLYKVIKEKTKV